MSLTIGAIAAGIPSAISNLGQGALTAIRIVAIVGFGSIFGAAILSLVGLIGSMFNTGFIADFFTIVSKCLPFDGGIIFGSLLLAIQGILAFLVAKKIYDLSSDIIGKTS